MTPTEPLRRRSDRRRGSRPLRRSRSRGPRSRAGTVGGRRQLLLDLGPGDLRLDRLRRARPRVAAGRRRPRQPRLRQPDGRRRARGGRDRARPRLRRRDRRPAVGPPRRADRLRLRPGHDRRDARAGAPQRRRGRRHQRRVPQGPDRVDPARPTRRSTSSSATASSTCRPTRPRSSPRSPACSDRAAGWASATSSPTTRLSPAERAERGSFAGCIAGALSFAEYRAGLDAVGLVDVEVTPTQRRRRRPAQRDHPGDQAGRLDAPTRSDRSASRPRWPGCRSSPTQGAAADPAAAEGSSTPR